MGFTVTRQGGTKDAEFQAYTRLLRQRGIDLGNLPRVPEPGTRRRWLYVWETANGAKEFADELRRRTGEAWEVVETAAPPSEGPLGSILLQLVRRADGLLIAVHPLTRAMIRSAFPEAVPATTNVFIGTQEWSTFHRARGGLAELVQQIAPALTGLTMDRLEELGYAVIDADTETTLVFVPPARLNHG